MKLQHSRRKDERDRRREDLLDAAEAAFAQDGFDAARMEDIARRARVSRALVYLYFKDKQDLQFAVALRGLELLRRRFAEARARHRLGIDQVSAIGRSYIAFVQEFPVYFNALARSETTHSALHDEASIQHRVMLAGRLVHVETVKGLQAGMADGSIRTSLGDPLRVAMTLWGFTHGIAQLVMTKSEMLAHEGVPSNSFINDSIDFATRALAP